jgi:hypothetical protein
LPEIVVVASAGHLDKLQKLQEVLGLEPQK